MNAKRLIFINSTVEADRYLVSARAGDVCVGLTAKVRSYLLKKGIIAVDTTRYFTNASHEKALLRSKDIVNWMRGRIDLPDSSANIASAYTDLLVFWARLAAHNFIWTVEIVLNAIEAHRPRSVCAPLSGGRISNNLSIEAEEKYLGVIVMSIAARKGISFEDLTAGEFPGSAVTRSKPRLGLLLSSIFKYGRFGMWQFITIIQARLSRQRVVLLTSSRYQMDAMAAQMQEHLSGARFCVLKSSVVIPVAVPDVAIRLFWSKNSKAIISNKERIRTFEREVESAGDIFSYREIAFAGLLAKKIRDNIADHVVGLMLWSIRLNKVIDAFGPMALLSNGTRIDDVALAEICKAKSIPDILISHGSHVPPTNEYEEIEWGEHVRGLLRGPFSHLALQSPLAEAYHRAFPTPSYRIETGPLIWGREIDRSKGALLFKKLFGGKYDRKSMKVVLHAGTPRLSKFLRLYVYETADEYLQALVDLARTVEADPGLILIIKFRPSNEIRSDDIKTLVGISERVVLLVDEPFSDVLGMADMLVSFSSTTIEEALQNGVPVLQYGGGGRYQHVAGYGISRSESVPPKAVYHVKKAEDLGYAIKSILSMDIDDKAGLFDPYVYPKECRKSLAAVLNKL